MDVVHQANIIREDRNLLVLTHLSQFLDYVTGFGGLVVPLVLWIVNKDRIIAMDEHGKSIINFQLSIILYCILSIPAILLLGLGLLSLLFIGVIAFVLPIVNAIKASRGESPDYYVSIPFLS